MTQGISLLFVVILLGDVLHKVEGCVDRLGANCQQYKHHCNNTLYKDYLGSNCAFTCNSCGQTTSTQSLQTTNPSKKFVAPGRAWMPLCGSYGSTKPNFSKVVGGTNAKPGSSPWQVIIDKLNYPSGRYCGGILISEEWVLTAAHCVYDEHDKSQFSIRIGAHDLSTVNKWQQTFKVREMHLHPYYDNVMVDYDIALIRLHTKVRYNQRIRPVCLPDATVQFDESSFCKISGWGKVTETKTGPAILQQAQVPLVDHRKCQQTYKRTFGWNVTERMLCTAHKNGTVGPCDGDSGGPLVCRIISSITGEEIWYAWGITSWGAGCAKKGTYSVYANIQNLRAWIVKKVFHKNRSVVS